MRSSLLSCALTGSCDMFLMSVDLFCGGCRPSSFSWQCLMVFHLFGILLELFLVVGYLICLVTGIAAHILVSGLCRSLGLGRHEVCYPYHLHWSLMRRGYLGLSRPYGWQQRHGHCGQSCYCNLRGTSVMCSPDLS